MDIAEFRRQLFANLIETKGTGTCKAEDGTRIHDDHVFDCYAKQIEE